MILFSEGATKAQEDEAESILEALTVAYPGYPWAVRVYDGGFFIRNLEFPANWGMNAKYKQFGYSASALKRQVIMMAGEWLERANLRRGRNNEDPIKRLEGVPENHQPASEKPPVQFDTVINAGGHDLRTAPRPQAVKAIHGD